MLWLLVKGLGDTPVSCEQALQELRGVQCLIKDSNEPEALAEQEMDMNTADMLRGYRKECEKLSWMSTASAKQL